MERPRMESSSSECRNESQESRSGGTRDQLGRGGRRAARPMMPPYCPPPPSTSPRRSPRLSQPSAARDLQRLLLSAKTFFFFYITFIYSDKILALNSASLHSLPV